MTGHLPRLALVAALVLAARPATAQCDALQWGRVPAEHLALTSYPADPDANAVILGDCGHAEVRLSGFEPTVYERRHARVKVLTAGGYDLGTVVLRVHRDVRVRRVRGQTFVPMAGGEPRRVEMRDDAVFENDLGDDVKEVRFTLPALEPGAVFEFSYEVVNNHFVTVGPWVFQSSEPTLYSYYKASLPAQFGYLYLAQGLEGVEREQSTRRSQDESFTDVEWTARTVPALRPEPHLTTLADYEMRVELQLREYVTGDGITHRFLSSWEEVARVLLDDDRFGRQLTGRPRGVRRQAEAVTAGVEGDVARARALYDFVRTSMAWNGRSGGVFLSDRVERVLASRSGNAADVNLTLLALLRAADIPADPVLLSTRPHGRALDQYPILSQFDRVVVLVRIDGALALLDATDPGRPYGVLPVEALTGLGWMVRSEPQWIDFQATVATGTATQVSGRLAPDGTLAGALSLRLSGYDAIAARRRIREADADPTVTSTTAAEAADADEGVDLVIGEVTGVEAVGDPIIVQGTLTARAADRVGETLYLNPFVLMGLDENPFQLQNRTFPVDFAYPFTRIYAAEITLPAGAVVDELPPPVRITVPQGGGAYDRSVEQVGDRVLVQARLQIQKVVFGPDAYAGLRAFYDAIVAAETEVLAVDVSDVTDAPPPPAAPDDEQDAADGEAATPGSAEEE